MTYTFLKERKRARHLTFTSILVIRFLYLHTIILIPFVLNTEWVDWMKKTPRYQMRFRYTRFQKITSIAV